MKVSPFIPILLACLCCLLAVHDASGAARQNNPSENGRTIAVVIGISNYRQTGVQPLEYADQDAQAFSDFLLTKRGGVARQDLTLLLNEKATLDAIRSSIREAFDTAKANDTVVLFLAGHGIAMDHGPNRGAYLLAVNSNPENLAASGLRMEELQELTSGAFQPRQVLVFVDACHSGIIGSIASRNFNRFATDDLADTPQTVFGLMASRFKELSYECANFHHGAFTYYLLRGLNGGEPADRQSGRVTTNGLIHYVREGVSKATELRQNPESRGNVGDRLQLADLRLPGSEEQSLTQSSDSCVESRGRDVEPPALQPDRDESADAFSEALHRGAILPGVPGSAFDILSRQRSTAEYAANRRRLLVALENSGQEVILEYLRGEQVSQVREQFAQGERYFGAAAQLAPNDSFIESRRLFCLGRKLIFDRNYQEALATLARSIQQFEPGAYANNAIGIAYLETSNFERAIESLREAVRLAPYWAYAQHNLALALTQAGQYAEAISVYQTAALLVPHYSYIRYNLGLLLQRLNRPQQARQEWSAALSLSPDMARAWNAIGLSYYLEGRYDRADTDYQKAAALARSESDRLAIRHDTALLRVAQGQTQEAIRLWRLNLAEQPDDLPTLLGLSQALERTGAIPEAMEKLVAVLSKNPDYAGARLRYARLLTKAKQPREAVRQLQLLIGGRTQNSEVFERLADAQKMLPDASAAQVAASYRQSLALATTRAQRKRIREKVHALGAQ